MGVTDTIDLDELRTADSTGGGPDEPWPRLIAPGCERRSGSGGRTSGHRLRPLSTADEYRPGSIASDLVQLGALDWSPTLVYAPGASCLTIKDY